MNTEQRYQAEPMTNNPIRRGMACSHSAPRQQANPTAFRRQDQRPTRFPTSPTEMSNQESAFYFVNEEINDAR